ncbi:MAG: hypothetical protein JNK77_05925 [Saprospiraceae bacterium]|nr:hypothetical protein [Saprospiraceae bacterium]
MKNKLVKALKKTALGVLVFGMPYLCIMLFPGLLFAHKIEYRQCIVYSDKKIDSEIIEIIDSSLTRMSKSELYDTSQQFRLFICNDLRRFWIFTQGSALAGAVAQYNFTRDIFFRPCDIPNNKIIPPKEWYFADNPFTFKDRPLTYYFAHEMTHVMQSRYTGRGSWKYPTWLTEGYADYIGKGENFNFQENLRLWHSHAPELDPSKGLYRLYHLKVCYLLDHKGASIKDIYQNIPNDTILTDEVWNLYMAN